MKNTLQIKVAELRKANDNKAQRIAELEIEVRTYQDHRQRIEQLEKQVSEMSEWKQKVVKLVNS